jgi:hypothetical protein
MNNVKTINIENSYEFNLAITSLNELVKENGVARDYKEYMASSYWKIRRQLYISQYDGICQHCHKKKENLQLHHCNYRNLTQERVEDCLLLCSGCHYKWESMKHEYREYLHKDFKRCLREAMGYIRPARFEYDETACHHN